MGRKKIAAQKHRVLWAAGGKGHNLVRGTASQRPRGRHRTMPLLGAPKRLRSDGEPYALRRKVCLALRAVPSPCVMTLSGRSRCGWGALAMQVGRDQPEGDSTRDRRSMIDCLSVALGQACCRTPRRHACPRNLAHTHTQLARDSTHGVSFNAEALTALGTSPSHASMHAELGGNRAQPKPDCAASAPHQATPTNHDGKDRCSAEHGTRSAVAETGFIAAARTQSVRGHATTQACRPELHTTRILTTSRGGLRRSQAPPRLRKAASSKQYRSLDDSLPNPDPELCPKPKAHPSHSALLVPASKAIPFPRTRRETRLETTSRCRQGK